MRKNLFLTIFSLALFFGATSAQAFCPVCVVAVGAGLELSHYLGIDDTITGLWIGALLFSLSIWTLDWLKKKKYKLAGKNFLVFFTFYSLTILPLYWSKLIGQPMHSLWGIDKLVLGIFFGSIVFFLGGMLNLFLKKKNDEKVYFPFQKVVIPVGLLFLLSFIFYFLTK
ncbi:MAG TPA: hypothetical protein DCS28_01470 [Candidatus Moranbacteria bacterium]|nr:hypothetical protein [Candidatus Moranbacteria bacterium]HAT74694.1 hypothetical protein [Candidatus Moranbacteria bacterium]